MNYFQGLRMNHFGSVVAFVIFQWWLHDKASKPILQKQFLPWVAKIRFLLFIAKGTQYIQNLKCKVYIHTQFLQLSFNEKSIF